MTAGEPDTGRRAFLVFTALAVVVFVALVVVAVFVVPALGGFSVGDVWASHDSWAALADRGPYILQAFGNLGLFWVTCACGALLFSRRARDNQVALAALAAVALVCAFLLHSMVWGIDLLVPSSRALLTLDHRPIILLPAVTTRIYGHGTFLDTTLSLTIHTLAPQVLLPLVIGALATRRLVRASRASAAATPLDAPGPPG